MTSSPHCQRPGFGGARCSISGIAPAAVQAASAQDAPPRQSWSFSGPFGIYDQAQLQRGFKIYREVCSTCHSLNLLSFRNLADPGGPGFTEAQAAAIAATFQVTDGPNDQGEMFQRPGGIADYFPPPFPNDNAARAALGGKLPPDMSVLAKARGYDWGFPVVRHRCVPDVSGGWSGLHPRHPQWYTRNRRRVSRCRRAASTTNISPAALSACRSR